MQRTGSPLILFVHGLAGSTLGTWAMMLQTLASDAELRGYGYDCYSFPTSLVRAPFSGKRSDIPELADGLDTFIQTYHKDKEIILVGHSLGGLVARHYILEKSKKNGASSIVGLLLFAVPNTGAAIASVGNIFSFQHRHLKQLCKKSEFLSQLNIEWAGAFIEQKIPTLYIIAGADAVVHRESAYHMEGSEKRTIIEFGHRDVIKPKNQKDIRYQVLKQFVISLFQSKVTTVIGSSYPNGTVAGATPDPLFDAYTPNVEPYYIQRAEDKALAEASKSRHLWICGPSGVGKTASLKRMIEKSGWQHHHIMLASYSGYSPLQLAGEICNQLYERAGSPNITVPKSADEADILKHLRTIFKILPHNGVLAIFVEEIPLAINAEYTNFLRIVYQIMLTVEAAVLPFRMVWIFSSINDPKPAILHDKAKFFERMQFLSLNPWKKKDIERLIQTACKAGVRGLDAEETMKVVDASDGFPRIAKAILRQRQYEIGQNLPIDTLIDSVMVDHAKYE